MHLDIHETTFSLFFSVILILNSILINIACDCLVKRFCKCIRNGFISLDVFFIRFNFAGVFSLFVSYLFYFIENICSFVLRSLFFSSLFHWCNFHFEVSKSIIISNTEYNFVIMFFLLYEFRHLYAVGLF